MSEVSNNVSINIKKFRKMSKMTQEQLANRLNLSKQIISAYEKGIRMPSYETLIDMSKIFSVTANDMFYNNLNSISVNLDGLTKKQKELIANMIDEFKSMNNKRIDGDDLDE